MSEQKSLMKQIKARIEQIANENLVGERWDADGNLLCYYCGHKIEDEQHVDHVFPRSKHGKNTARNYAISCPHCNHVKRAKHPFVWFQSIDDLPDEIAIDFLARLLSGYLHYVRIERSDPQGFSINRGAGDYAFLPMGADHIPVDRECPNCHHPETFLTTGKLSTMLLDCRECQHLEYYNLIFEPFLAKHSRRRKPRFPNANREKSES